MPPQEKPAPTTRDGPLLGAAREKPSRVHGDLGQPQISEYGKKREHFMFEFMEGTGPNLQRIENVFLFSSSLSPSWKNTGKHKPCVTKPALANSQENHKHSAGQSGQNHQINGAGRETL